MRVWPKKKKTLYSLHSVVHRHERAASEVLSARGSRSWLRPWALTALAFQWINQHLPVLNPTSRRRQHWDLLIITFVVYNAILVPLEAGFDIKRTAGEEYAEVVIDVLFFLDILLNLRTGYVTDNGNVVYDPSKIMVKYARSWLAVDLLASLPVEHIMSLAGLHSSGFALVAVLKTPRLLRLGRLLRRNSFLERTKGTSSMKIVKLMILMCLIAHWLACAWEVAYLLEGGRSVWRLEALEGKGEEGQDIATEFLDVIYRAFLVMVGDNVQPLNNLERGICVVGLVLGVVFYSNVVGNMALLVNSISSTCAKHKHTSDMVQDATRYLGVPWAVRHRIGDYFDLLVAYLHPGPSGMDLLRDLPNGLSQDICVGLYKAMLATIPIFAGCEDNFLNNLTMGFALAVYTPGETVFRELDVGEELCVVMRGCVAVINKYGETLAILGEGKFFGDLALLSVARRTASVVCISQCDVAILSASVLAEAFKLFPESAARVRNAAARRLNAFRLKEKVRSSVGGWRGGILARRDLSPYLRSQELTTEEGDCVESFAAVPGSSKSDEVAGRAETDQGGLQPRWVDGVAAQTDLELQRLEGRAGADAEAQVWASKRHGDEHAVPRADLQGEQEKGVARGEGKEGHGRFAIRRLSSRQVGMVFSGSVRKHWTDSEDGTVHLAPRPTTRRRTTTGSQEECGGGGWTEQPHTGGFPLRRLTSRQLGRTFSRTVCERATDAEAGSKLSPRHSGRGSWQEEFGGAWGEERQQEIDEWVEKKLDDIEALLADLAGPIFAAGPRLDQLNRRLTVLESRRAAGQRKGVKVSAS